MSNQHRLAQMALNYLCDVCHKSARRVYCECTGSRIYLCVWCVSGHIDNNSGHGHELIPAYFEVSNMQEFRERSDALIAGKLELDRNLARIDQCCAELTTTVENMVWRLTEYLRAQVLLLRQMKATLSADIQMSVGEVEFALAQDSPQFTARYAQFLRHFEKDKLVLFDYEINPNLAEMAVQRMPNFALLSPGQYRNPLVHLRPDQVKTFNFEGMAWGRPTYLQETIEFDEDSVYTAVDTSQVFCCGCKIPCKRSMGHSGYLVDITSGTVEKLRPLSIARSAPGVLHYLGELFVFGCKSHAAYSLDQVTGVLSTQKEVEMLRLAARRWVQLQSMPTGRCAFTPSVHSGYAYLCYGKDTFIDVMELRTRTFLAPVPVELPDLANRCAVTVVIGDELIVVTKHHSTAVKFSFPVSIPSIHRELNVRAASTPLKYGNKVYWVNNSFQCVCASGSKCEIVEIME